MHEVDDQKRKDTSSPSEEDVSDGKAPAAWRLEDPGNVGLVAHSVTLGFILGSQPVAMTGFFLGYLNMPSYMVQVAQNLLLIPGAFSFLFGMLSDCAPILKRRRKPYMVLGWALTCVAFLCLYLLKQPAPYYCRLSDGTYDYLAPPCNRGARAKFLHYVLLYAFGDLGVAISAAAAQGLIVEKMQQEPEHCRGSIQAELSVMVMLGIMLGAGFAAGAMNGKEYMGTFDHSLSFNQMAGVLAIPAAFTAALCTVSLKDPPMPAEKTMSFAVYGRAVVELLSSKAFFYIILYLVGAMTLGGFHSPASRLIAQQWAGVRLIYQSGFAMLQVVIAALGLWLLHRYLHAVSWRKTLLVSYILVLVQHLIPELIVTSGLVRNQFFLLAAPLFAAAPRAIVEILPSLIITEYAGDVDAGLVGGMLRTVMALSMPLSGTLSNQIFAFFPESLSERSNYLQDRPSFRHSVAMSLCLAGFVNVLGLTFLLLLPDQRHSAHERRSTWPKHSCYLIATTALLALLFFYLIAVDLGAMIGRTACLRIIGGRGCS